jgi:hypothetical protein
MAKVTIQVSVTQFQTKEVTLPCYTHMDTGDDNFSADHWTLHEEKRHITISERDYYGGHVTYEIEVCPGHGLGGSGQEPCSEAMWVSAAMRMRDFISRAVAPKKE